MINPNDIEYVMLKLDEQSKQRLIRLTSNFFKNRYQKIYCDHITLAYGREQVSKFDMSLFDTKVSLHGNTVIYDNNAAAMLINRKDVEEFGINNKYPHITLATIASTRPVYSNKLLENFFVNASGSNHFVLDDPIILNFTILPSVYRNKYQL